MIKHSEFTNLPQFNIVYSVSFNMDFKENILVLQNESVQPGSQFEQVPF